tara:strand:- start:81 stop:212 length:132 start_codon:yes stop_codon:yes gene_type:complete
MIENIITILSLDDFFNKSKRIDVAKGKHELTTSFKKAWKQRKR